MNYAIADLKSQLRLQRPDGRIPEEINWYAEEQNFFQSLGSKFQYSNKNFTDTTQMPVLPYRFCLVGRV